MRPATAAVDTLAASPCKRCAQTHNQRHIAAHMPRRRTDTRRPQHGGQMALQSRAVCSQVPGMMVGSVLVAAPARRLISRGLWRVCYLLAQATGHRQRRCASAAGLQVMARGLEQILPPNLQRCCSVDGRRRLQARLAGGQWPCAPAVVGPARGWKGRYYQGDAMLEECTYFACLPIVTRCSDAHELSLTKQKI